MSDAVDGRRLFIPAVIDFGLGKIRRRYADWVKEKQNEDGRGGRRRGAESCNRRKTTLSQMGTRTVFERDR